MKRPPKNNQIYPFFLVLFLLLTSFLSARAFKKVDIQDIQIYGSKLFSKKDIVQNSSLILPTRLIFIKTKFIEEELKKTLSLEKVSINRQILPFELRVLIKTREPIAYGEKTSNGKNISGFIDQDGFFIKNTHVEKVNLEKLSIQVYGWQDNYRKILSEILTFQKKNKIELIKISITPNGFITLEEKDLKKILIGFDSNLIKSQLQIIRNLKEQYKKLIFLEKIDNIDLTDPKNPKIKVFKP